MMHRVLATRAVVATAMVLGGGLGASLISAGPASATGSATLHAAVNGTGTTCTSSHPCLLSEALSRLTTSSLHGDAVTVTLASGTYTAAVLSPDLTDVASLVLTGHGEATTVLDGTTDGRVFTLSTGTATVQNLSITHGTTTNTGGDVYAGGTTLTLTDVTIRTGHATDVGGGVGATRSSVLTLSGVVLQHDTASGGGGVQTAGVTTISDSTISHDTATGGGGGVVMTDGLATTALTLRDDTFLTDHANAGGAIWNASGGSLVAIDDTVVDSTGEYGGALYDTVNPATFTDSTFVGDTSTNLTGAAVADINKAHVTFTFDTLAEHDHGSAPVLRLTNATGSSVIENSILSTVNCGGASTFTDGGHNVSNTSGNTCHLGALSAWSGISSVKLATALAANTSTGPQTLAIGPTSPAFGAVPTASCTTSTDERGLPRPGLPGHACDAGAYEYQSTGYDLVGEDGGVFVFDAPGQTGGFFGSLPGIHVVPNQPVVGIVPTRNDQGYFLVGRDGGVFSFGNAPFLGSLPGINVTPTAPIVGIVATDTDKGYYLVGQDGGVFAFGTAPYLGSLPGEHISVENIMGIAATPSGNGYWLVASTGKVYSFGDAKSFTTVPSTSTVTAIAGTPTGGGYWLVTVLGGVYAYGTAKKVGTGTLPNIHVMPNLEVIGIVPTVSTTGYWLLGLDGGVFAFGNAPYLGSLPQLGVHVTDIVGAVPN